MRTLRNLLRILSPRERRQALLLMPLLTLMAFLQVVGIASITPFLAIVADPSAVQRHEALRWLFAAGGFADTREFLIALGVLMFVLIVASNALTAFATWALLRFSWMRSHTVGLRLFRHYLARPYVFYLERHSADLGKNLLTEVNQVVSGIVVPLMRALAGSIVVLSILALLLYLDPLLALFSGLVLGGSYALIFFAIRRSQRRMGKLRVAANRGRFEILSEAFGGIKEVKLLGRERQMLDRFRAPSHEFASATAANAVVGQLPRFALEAIAFGGIVLMVLYLLGQDQPFRSILPILGLYAFAGYRLMPWLQQVFLGLTNARFNSAALETLLEDLPADGSDCLPAATVEPLPLTDRLRLCGVDFAYAGAPHPLFQNLDLTIEARTSVAFVGETGSGKSTLVDLVLGLLRPDAGYLEVDGTEITEANLRHWQSSLGYVPQSIFLTDESVAHNVAFGIPDEDVDMDAVRRACRAAAIDRFIEESLAEGYDTLVGERGVRLSGGQRQRLGIARALYHDPPVLILDEATSALDSATEEQVLTAVTELAQDRTVIMVAHRLTTVRGCDRIFLLSAGRVRAAGTYDELLLSNPDFRALAQGGTA